MTRPLFPSAVAILLTIVALPLLSLFAEESPVTLQPLYTHHKLERPISLQVPPDATGRRFLMEQTGRIKILPSENSTEEAAVFFDMTKIIGVEKDFEEGLLGLAFHPKFAENGRFYLSFSRQGPKRLVLAEFQVFKDNPGLADPASERVLLEIQQPDWNHNSGNLFFGPQDGKLYLCAGDGGMKNGVFMLPQKLTRWNGKVLRIDVDARTGSLPYGIPDDNPFIANPIDCPEIWAYGLRNPWGAAIDPETGLFYLADVGQDAWEEINIIQKGGNYGWEYREGAHDFPGRNALITALGLKTGIPEGFQSIDPVFEYSRADGISITGGYVYRGAAIPALAGHFLYGDWRFGNLWALHYDPATAKVVANIVLEKPADPKTPTVQPTAFCPDEKGEPLVLDWRGAIFKMMPRG